MKAVVMEVKDGYAAVLSEDGQFIKVEDAGYVVGMELSLEEKKTRKDITKILSLKNRRFYQSAAAIAAALLIFIGINDFNTPYGVVSLDVNPSIEISINRYDRVLDIDAVNDDAEIIVEKMNAGGIRYKSIEDAVDMALNSFSEGDYAADDGKTYVVISSNYENSGHASKVADSLEDICKNHEDISAQTITADDELIERARELGTTAGKLYLVENLKDVSDDETFDEADWLEKPVKDIIYEINNKIKNESTGNPKETSDNIEKAPDIEKSGQTSVEDKKPDKIQNEEDYSTGKMQDKSDYSTDKPQEKAGQSASETTGKAANSESDGQLSPEQSKVQEKKQPSDDSSVKPETEQNADENITQQTPENAESTKSDNADYVSMQQTKSTEQNGSPVGFKMPNNTQQ